MTKISYLTKVQARLLSDYIEKHGMIGIDLEHLPSALCRYNRNGFCGLTGESCPMEREGCACFILKFGEVHQNRLR